MSDWERFDFAVTHVKRNDAGDIVGLKGHVVEDGTVRDLPIELTPSKAIEYLGYEGVFCTAREQEGNFAVGAEIDVDDSGDQPVLTTPSSAPEEVSLSGLPTY